MTPCWFGMHRWSHWGDCFSAGDGRVMQARYCLRCRCAGTRTVARLVPAAGVVTGHGSGQALPPVSQRERTAAALRAVDVVDTARGGEA